MKVIAYAIVIVLCIFAGLLALYTFVPPVSTLMLGRTLTGKSYERTYVRLKDVAPVLVASVVSSEDAQFCRHGGVDWSALRKVIAEADEDGPSRGASTITMQTAKNLFLWPGRSSLRKGMEIGIALVLGKVWSRAHTLEVYLNIAEWGDGLFGIEAAARHYFQKRASQLTAREAALLATSLPNPILRDAARPRPFQNRLAARIAARARGSAGYLDCLPR
ncbi:monofunctional biosynthetic peptidoglycan transglycosylase [Roseiarcaceae bacterium H3SJ34-1]|uniref:monofunctional biosynthetic peptidoglycan transglycosylase n=1 Tax=Terripilifer ovatus TaxID=3032367 RepID=UPI003AB9A6FA|nr:monofunctional biosynthetic peptidoglycan transglycosylase [Roseiarcaceae bacterium H3SJ34-1]